MFDRLRRFVTNIVDDVVDTPEEVGQHGVVAAYITNAVAKRYDEVLAHAEAIPREQRREARRHVLTFFQEQFPKKYADRRHLDALAIPHPSTHDANHYGKPHRLTELYKASSLKRATIENKMLMEAYFFPVMLVVQLIELGIPVDFRANFCEVGALNDMLQQGWEARCVVAVDFRDFERFGLRN